MHFINNLTEAIVTQIAKTGYHLVPYHMRSTNIFETFFVLVTSVSLQMVENCINFSVFSHLMEVIQWLAFVFLRKLVYHWIRWFKLSRMVFVSTQYTKVSESYDRIIKFV